jgi:hypothetical protein
VFPLVELLGASTDIVALESLALVTKEERQQSGVLRTDIDALKHSFPLLFDANRQPGAMCSVTVQAETVASEPSMAMPTVLCGGLLWVIRCRARTDC